MSNVKCPKTLQQKLEEVWNQVMNYTPTEGDYIMYAGDLYRFTYKYQGHYRLPKTGKWRLEEKANG